MAKILFKALLTNTKHILFFSFFFLLGITKSTAQDIPVKRTLPKLENSKIDKKVSKKLKLNPEKEIKKDSVKIDSVILPKELLEDVIIDKAKGYKTINMKSKLTTLYDEAELYYQDIELKSGKIIIDFGKNLAYAKGIIDSTGAYIQRPTFKQGSQETIQDSLIYNYKTKKALVYGARTEQQGMIIDALLTKRENDSTMYLNRAEITTSKKKKRDYFIATKNIKFVPGKKAVGGTSQLFLADVPTPLILPFFYVPLTKGRASGILIPTYGDNKNGYFLQNGGFYFAINDYVDLAATGDIYTNGSWGLRFDSNYKYRYKFGGRVGIRFENLINGQRGLSNYTKTKTFHINWSHSQDTKSSPTSRFSASVNFGSSKFFRQSLNELSTPNFLKNTLSSSISYYKKFEGTPFNMNIALTHSQNTNTEVINMSLPNLTIGMDRLYPFAPKNGVKKNPIQNIGLTYSLALQNQIATTDAEFFQAGMFDKAKSGMVHKVSLSTNIKALKYITLSPNVSYRDVWYLKTINKTWDSANNKVVVDTINGFKTFRDYNGSVSASTKLYGTFKFKKGKLTAIRHTLTPSISYGYTPDFSNYYEDIQTDALGNTSQYSQFDNGLYGRPNLTSSQNLSFNLRNTFEAKIKDDDPTKTEGKKLKLLNNFDFSASYNLEADTLKWTPVRFSTSTVLFKQLNLTLNASLDPYAITATGKRIDKFNINNGGSLFRLTDARLTASFNMSNDTFKKTKDTDKKEDDNKNNQYEEQFGGDLRDRNNSTTNNKEEEKTKKVNLYELKIPWRLNLNYNVGYNNRNREDEFGTNTLRFNGNVELTPKWGINFSSGYDFEGKGLSYTTLGFARDLDSWHMSFNWTPLGDRSTYYFFIGVKASALSDLKYDQHKVPDKNLF